MPYAVLRLSLSMLLALLPIRLLCAGDGPIQLDVPSARTEDVAGASVDAESVEALAAEVRAQGWIIFAARSSQQDWDLFLCRPDGSDVRNITRTPAYSEFSACFSPDATRILYRRVAPSETIDDNQHGTQGVLVVARSDGSHPTVLGAEGEWAWASWSPDGKQIACLTMKGIQFVDLASRQVLRTLPRKGFFQQMSWSPDGKWLAGVANSFGESWSIARMDAANGEAMAVNKVDCCTPDWFPDSQQVIFSWRPRGQQANNGYGWTQLWRATADGRSRALVYGEDERHVYGGCVSPDGKYALFTGNVREDGDPQHAGAPMGLMRLSDGPIIGGESRALRALHPSARNGPVLVLPKGWEPAWTYGDEPGKAGDAGAAGLPLEEETALLATELRDRGWIVLSSKTERGDWDLRVMRPDGSDRHAITDSPEFHEAGARFSPDGKRLLWYRMPITEAVDNNSYGTYELVIADANGGEPVVLGRGFDWASWGPAGQQLACLARDGVRVVDLATRKTIRRFPRHGIVSQLGWAPDGSALVGTANGLGTFWNIGVLNAASGDIAAVSEPDRYNCTPDWMPDSRHVIYSRGIIPTQDGRAEVWMAAADGNERRPLYREPGRHLYGACASPDGRYLLFTRSVEDLGQVDQADTTISIIRLADTPMVGEELPSPGRPRRDAKSGPRLDLGPGWEPHWAFAAVKVPE